MGIVDDFIKGKRDEDGYGFFEGDSVAVAYSKKITKRQRRKLKRRGKVPLTFLHFLRDEGLIQFDGDIPRVDGLRNIDNLPEILRNFSYPNSEAKDAIEFLTSSLHRERFPVPEKIHWRYRKPYRLKK